MWIDAGNSGDKRVIQGELKHPESKYYAEGMYGQVVASANRGTRDKREGQMDSHRREGVKGDENVMSIGKDGGGYPSGGLAYR